MGSTINPRARGGSSLSAELRASRDDRQQIRRLIQSAPKPSQGGAGQVLGVTRCIPTSFGSYFDPVGQWGTLYASGHDWAMTNLSGTGPTLTTSSAGDDTSTGLDGIVVSQEGWYSFRLQFYITFSSGFYQPTATYAAVSPPRGSDYSPVEANFPIMSGGIPGAVPVHSELKRSVGMVGTDPMLLTVGTVVALHVSWDAGQTLQPNMDGRPRCLVDVTQYA